MYISELYFPGIWLVVADKALKREARTIIDALGTCLADADVALSLFEAASAQVNKDVRMVPHEARVAIWEQEGQQRERIEGELIARLGSPSSREEMEALRFRVDVEAKRENWRAGKIPRGHQGRAPFLHARSFVAALDMAGKLLKALAQLPGAPATLDGIANGFRSSFVHLKDVRDTTQHLEERALGKKRDGKPIDLQPIDNDIVAGSPKALLLESFFGNLFVSTTSSGHSGEVEVSAKSLQLLRDAIQKALDAFTWRGGPDHTPR